MLKVLERLPNVPIKTMISYEGPHVGDNIIQNYQIQRMIQVRGTESLLEGDFGPSFLDFNEYKAIDQFGNTRPIENYYIEIIGAGHSDFDYHPEYTDPVQREISYKTNLFMRELAEK